MLIQLTIFALKKKITAEKHSRPQKKKERGEEKQRNYKLDKNKPTKRKVDIANELGVKVLNQKDLIKMLNK